MDFLLNILSHWESALAVLLVLGGLIFFHELGHFAVARLFRIGVRTFSLGFGPKLLKLRRGKTDYCLSLIPLGGYVALAGEEDEAEQPDPKGKEIDGVLFAPEELYSGRPAWHRLLVVLAGPVANFVLALIIYCGIAWAQGQTYLLPEVGDVTPGTPAATAGILPGDRVLSIDGKPIENWNAVAEGIGAGNGKPVTIVLSRGGSEVTLSLTPEAKTRANIFGEEKPAWLIGIRASTATGHLPLGPVEAIGAGFRQTWDMKPSPVRASSSSRSAWFRWTTWAAPSSSPRWSASRPNRAFPPYCCSRRSSASTSASSTCCPSRSSTAGTSSSLRLK